MEVKLKFIWKIEVQFSYQIQYVTTKPMELQEGDSFFVDSGAEMYQTVKQKFSLSSLGGRT